MCEVKIGRLGKFDLNPRGELWYKDENRFGQKFLSKYGWSQGKGLGKNEDGIAENLKVRMKLGNTGVGWNEKLPIGIDYHDYDAVLKDLSKRYQTQDESKSDISLEKRSQQFKNRIHYQKFVRGKDISQYSEKDMSCIFLSRKPDEKLESPPKGTATNTESSVKEPTPTFISQMSISDYFAMKMKNKMGGSRESKSFETPSLSETGSKSQKEMCDKKSRQIHPKQQFSTIEGSLLCGGDPSEPPRSSQEASEDNSFSDKQFENPEESHNVTKKNKSSKKVKKLFTASYKSQLDISSEQQKKYDLLAERSASCQSQLNSPEEPKNEVVRKKRKKDKKNSKKAKKRCFGKREISPSLEEKSSRDESDDTEKNSFEGCSAESQEAGKQSYKENERHKNKINLRSCLKSCLNNKFNFKKKRNVSFCENISYQIIENVPSKLDSDITFETLSQSDKDSKEIRVMNELENIERTSDDSNILDESAIGNEHNDPSSEESSLSCDLSEDNSVPECFKLPKRSSANYDSWLETQRIAARMKVYKNMVKKMKKHPILRKTNLLEIKGYGNWGL